MKPARFESRASLRADHFSLPARTVSVEQQGHIQALRKLAQQPGGPADIAGQHQRDALIGPIWIGLDDQYCLQGDGVDFIATGTDDQIPRAGLDGDDAILRKPSEDSISGSAKKPRPLLPWGQRGLIGHVQLDFPAPIQGRQISLQRG